MSLLAATAAVYLVLSLSSYQATDPGWSHSGPVNEVANQGGVVGAWLADVFLYLFGYLAYLFPVMVALAGWLAFHGMRHAATPDIYHWLVRGAGFVLTLTSGCGLATLHFHGAGLPLDAGGVLGNVVGGNLAGVFPDILDKQPRIMFAGYETLNLKNECVAHNIPDLNLNELADDLKSSLEAVGVGERPVLLIGFSMGGALALNVAATHPPDYLVLLAPFWRFSRWEGHILPLAKHLVKSFRPFAKADFADTAVRQQLKEMLPEADLDDPQLQKHIRQEIQLPTKTIDEVRLLGKEGGKLIPKITCPTLVLQGSADTVVPPKQTRRLITQLAGPLTYRELPGNHTFPKMRPPNQHNITTDILRFVS